MIAILGAGAMGEAYVSGLLRSGIEPHRVAIVEKNAERAAQVSKRYGVHVMDLDTAVRESATVLILVKPQDMPDLLQRVAPDLNDGAIVVSLVAGFRLDRLEEALGAGTPVVRAMPNTPALIGQGTTAISPGQYCSLDQCDYVVSLLSAVGPVVRVPETLQDAVTATSGSGPAYAFLLIESMIAASEALGLDAETARLLVTQTVLGAAMMAAEPGADAAALRRQVTSPQGTTAAALSVFETAGFGVLVERAMTAARDRSIELGAPPA